jgi:hypothetical protein
MKLNGNGKLSITSLVLLNTNQESQLYRGFQGLLRADDEGQARQRVHNKPIRVLAPQ